MSKTAIWSLCLFRVGRAGSSETTERLHCVGRTSAGSGRHQVRRLSTGITVPVSHANRNGTGALQLDEARDADGKVGVKLVGNDALPYTETGTEVTFIILTITFTKTH
jgi:hypothetical protein